VCRFAETILFGLKNHRVVDRWITVTASVVCITATMQKGDNSMHHSFMMRNMGVVAI
jgi:hypothetical protein